MGMEPFRIGLNILSSPIETNMILQLANHPWIFHGIFMVFLQPDKFCQIAWQGENIVVKKPLHFGLLLQGQGTFQKKLDIRTTSLSCTNRGHESSNDQKPTLV